MEPGHCKGRTGTVGRLALLGLSLVAGACGGDGSRDVEEGSGAPSAATMTGPTCASLLDAASDSLASGPGGLGIRTLREGEGRPAAPGDTVVAHYLGCLTDGTRFDTSYGRGEPFSFVLGAGRVIAGWDEGLRGMRPGEVRILRIPPGLGYGARGTPGGPIPPDATLLFRVELVDLGSESPGSPSTGS